MKQPLWLLATLLLILSCKKPDLEQQFTTVQEEKFFNLTTTLDTTIKSFASEIRRRSNHEFDLQKLIQNHGYALWDEALVSNVTEGDMAIIPIAQVDKKEVDGFIFAKKDKQNRFAFQLYSESDIEFYPTRPDRKFLTLNQFYTVFDYLNFFIFNDSVHKVRLLVDVPDDIADKFEGKLDRSKLFGKVRFPKTASMQARMTQSCFTYLEHVDDVWHDPGGAADPCDCSGDEYFLYSIYRYVTVCWDDPVDQTSVPLPGGGGMPGW